LVKLSCFLFYSFVIVIICFIHCNQIFEYALVPVWSTVAVMGMPLKDINKEIGMKSDPESWGDLHMKVIDTDNELITKKGYHSWAVGICAGEIVDAIVRNTCACFTVSTFVKVYLIRLLNFILNFYF